ncbi:MAG: MauE/DoxX family redox-associated membrane protein [Acidimicrobiales bacterium]
MIAASLAAGPAASPAARVFDGLTLFGQTHQPIITGIASTMAVALAAVFAVAAATKISSRSTTVGEFDQLGLPAPAILARIVPAAELIVTAALVIRPRLGATMATIMLLGFTAVIVATIRSGRTVSCGCLGALGRQPITAATAARNLAFLAMAGLASTTSSLAMPGLLPMMASLSLLLLAALSIQLLALRQEIGRIWSVELAGENNNVNLEPKDIKGMMV